MRKRKASKIIRESLPNSQCTYNILCTKSPKAGKRKRERIVIEIGCRPREDLASARTDTQISSLRYLAAAAMRSTPHASCLLSQRRSIALSFGGGRAAIHGHTAVWQATQQCGKDIRKRVSLLSSLDYFMPLNLNRM